MTTSFCSVGALGVLGLKFVYLGSLSSRALASSCLIGGAPKQTCTLSCGVIVRVSIQGSGASKEWGG